LLQDPQVKTRPRNFLFGYVRLAIIGALAVILVAIIGLVVHWQPLKTLQRQQNTLLGAIESKKGARFRRMVSSEYRDRWGFNVDDITEAMLDARSQFLALVIHSKDQEIKVNGKEAVITCRLTLGGTPIVGGSEVTRRINQLKDPFVFTWRKQSFLPSSWRLISIENPSIPDNVWNYEPGSIRAAMEGR
jgi:hypothetical protein